MENRCAGNPRRNLGESSSSTTLSKLNLDGLKHMGSDFERTRAGTAITSSSFAFSSADAADSSSPKDCDVP